jgi:hypothetical protein
MASLPCFRWRSSIASESIDAPCTFAAACWLGSVYGFLQGAWPFGLVEAIWGVVAARRWWKAGAVKRYP